MASLADALFSTTLRRLLALLYGRPEQSFYFKQILRLTGVAVATIKREKGVRDPYLPRAS